MISISYDVLLSNNTTSVSSGAGTAKHSGAPQRFWDNLIKYAHIPKIGKLGNVIVNQWF